MPGDISGPVTGRPYTGRGGLSVRINGAAQGVRDAINFADTPGLVWTGADDAGNDRVNVTGRFDGEVLLGSAMGLDAVAGFDFNVVGVLPTTRAQLTRLVIVAETVGGVTVQPNFQSGVDLGSGDEMAASQAMALTADGQIQELVLVNPRPSITQVPGSRFVRVSTPGLATATNYIVGVRAYGTIITP